jgi:hypothetical protein
MNSSVLYTVGTVGTVYFSVHNNWKNKEQLLPMFLIVDLVIFSNQVIDIVDPNRQSEHESGSGRDKKRLRRR